MNHGMFVQIREGSAARNFEALYPLLADHPLQMMLCSDDKHPDNLIKGHIDALVRRAVANGIDLYNVLWAACINPVKHYNLDVGLLNEGDPADFIIVDNLKDFNVQKTYINGQLVAKNGKSLIQPVSIDIVNKFAVNPKTASDFALKATAEHINVIEALDGELVTNKITVKANIKDGFVVSDPGNDILKLTVVNRYEDVPPAIAFIKNIGLKVGAIASSVGHDSHNITAVGVDDESIAKAVNLVIENKGGLSVVTGNEAHVLPLPVAGLMSDQDGYKVAEEYTKLDKLSKDMGSKLNAPFMTLSFMALLVIPSIKLSDKGLFDGDDFKFIKVFA
jgi:adenine deaminase